MPPIFSNKRLIILLVSLIILVALIGYSMKGNKQALWPQQFLNDTVGWVQSALYQPAHSVAGFFKNIDNMKEVYDENKQLKSKLEKNATLSRDNHRLKKRNEELNKLLGKTKSDSLTDYTVRQARVIARSPDQWNKQTTINKGKKDGISKNMAVMNADGIIGKVKSVGPSSATVQLVSDLNRTNYISAVVQGKKDIHGMIEGYDSDKDMLAFKLIPHDAKLKKGQMVETSGLGGVFPAGLEIGKVKEVESDPQGLTKEAYVKPSADLHEFYNVLVVERKAPSPNDGGGAS